MENQNKLTDEQVEVISKTLEDSKSEENKNIAELPSNKGSNERVPEDPNAYDKETVTAYIDPVTGEKTPVPTEIDPLSRINLDTSSFDSLLNMDDEDIRNIEISDDELKAVLKVKASKEDFIRFKNVFNRYKNGDEDFSIYNALPIPFRRYIDEVIGDFALDGNAKADTKDLRSVICKSLFDQIIQENYQNKVYTDLNTVIDKSFKDLSKSITSETNVSVRDKILSFRQLAEKIREEDPEKADQLVAFVDAYDEARNYTKFIEAIKTGKLRAKNIELSKYPRTCAQFNNRYASSSKIIDYITPLAFIIMRHTKCSMEDAQRVVIAYIKYVDYAKLNINKLPDYCFMYYFTKNILGLDNHDESMLQEKIYYANIATNLKNVLSEIINIEDNIINKHSKGGPHNYGTVSSRRN